MMQKKPSSSRACSTPTRWSGFIWDIKAIERIPLRFCDGRTRWTISAWFCQRKVLKLLTMRLLITVMSLHHGQWSVVWTKNVFRKFTSPEQTVDEKCQGSFGTALPAWCCPGIFISFGERLKPCISKILLWGVWKGSRDKSSPTGRRESVRQMCRLLKQCRSLQLTLWGKAGRNYFGMFCASCVLPSPSCPHYGLLPWRFQKTLNVWDEEGTSDIALIQEVARVVLYNDVGHRTGSGRYTSRCFPEETCSINICSLVLMFLQLDYLEKVWQLGSTVVLRNNLASVVDKNPKLAHGKWFMDVIRELPQKGRSPPWDSCD